MANEQMGLLGRKVGMTQIYSDDGEQIGVTVVEAGGNVVTAVKTSEGNDGYNAVQLGFDEKKEARTSKANIGHFSKANTSPKKQVREVRITAEETANFTPGQELATSDVFSQGDSVDVTGISKGRGFAGVMKKYGFKGFIRSHGTHEFFRHGGSIGTRLTPGHVLKGKKMPGQMGAQQVTVQNLTVVKADAEKGLLFIKGGVPGPNGGYLIVRKAVKK